MDNGRSTLVGGRFAEVLRCIRCGACLNACPVYRNIGGHAYGGVYPGPIGSLVSPLLHGLDGREALPRASSLCGACRVACPVNIDIPSLLVRLRTASRDSRPLSKRIAMRLWQCVLESPALYTVAQWLLRRLLRDSGDGWSQRLPGSVGGWTTTRDVPIPRESFRNRWRRMLENAHEPD
jgi:L-lactate dehydrogenase complex protein LldF